VQVWSAHLKDVECLEWIQRKATNFVKGLKRKRYEERLKILKFNSLQQRSLRGDLIQTYKILTGKERVDSQLFFPSATDSHNLRGHSLKLFLPRRSTTARSTFFSTRVVSHWNSLPHHVVEAPSVNAFKNRLDKYWSYGHLKRKLHSLSSSSTSTSTSTFISFQNAADIRMLPHSHTEAAKNPLVYVLSGRIVTFAYAYDLKHMIIIIFVKLCKKYFVLKDFLTIFSAANR